MCDALVHYNVFPEILGDLFFCRFSLRDAKREIDFRIFIDLQLHAVHVQEHDRGGQAGSFVSIDEWMILVARLHPK